MFFEKIWLGDVDLQIKLHLENRPNSSTKCLSKYVTKVVFKFYQVKNRRYFMLSLNIAYSVIYIMLCTCGTLIKRNGNLVYKVSCRCM